MSAPAEAYPVKVLQFGDGNFLRGFADWMIDILNEHTPFKGGVVVVAPLRRGRPSVADAQEGRYHVVLRGISDGKRIDEVRLITCVDRYIDPYNEFEKLLTIADLPSLQLLISNTTEAGIAFNPDDSDPNSPADSFPGKVTQLLYRRFNTFSGDVSKGLTILPCELIEQNGNKLKNAVLQHADHWKLSMAFAQWVDNACTFSNTLVDRIVTGYPTDYAHQIMTRTGYKDERLVAAEPYHLWVIETSDDMNKVFPVEGTRLNVKFVPDLNPYRTIKVRVLNGAHTAMTLVGYLRGLRTVREAVEDEWMSKFLDGLMKEEVMPTIPLPHDEVKHYVNAVFERFRNPEIRHELKSIALNSVSKFRARLLPTMLDYYQTNKKLPKHIIDVLASLFVFYRGQWRGEQLPVSDNPETIKAFADSWRNTQMPDIRHLLSDAALWGSDLTAIDGLAEDLEKAIAKKLTAEP